MKKLFIISVTLIGLVLSGCSSQEPEMPEFKEDVSQNIDIPASSIRTLDEAASIAQEAIGMLPGHTSRAGIRTFSKFDVKILHNTSTSRSLPSDTLFYVFNFNGEEGFAIVAANRNLEPLVAVTEQGSYNPDEPIDNPGFADFMERAIAYSRTPVDFDSIKVIKPGTGLAQYKVTEETLEEWEITPNYNLKWGQDYPEGILFSNGIAGCTNTAMAIIMSYFNSPESLELTYGSQPETITLNWSEIKIHNKSYSYPGFYDACNNLFPSNHDTISKLVRQLGELNGSFPTTTVLPNDSVIQGTGTKLNMSIPTFKKLGYNVQEYVQMSENVLSNISLNCKILVYGKNASTDSAHNWVIDGEWYRKIRHCEWLQEENDLDWKLMLETIVVSKSYHCNWGWNGYANGWFNYNYFNPGTGAEYDGSKPNTSTKYEASSLKCLLVRK